MIGKTGALIEIRTYLFEIYDFIEDAKHRIHNDRPGWKQEARYQIDLTLHILLSHDDASVEHETPDCRDGLKFTYIRRGYGAEGAQVHFNRGDDMLEIRFWTRNFKEISSFEYKKDRDYTSLSFKKSDDPFIFYEEEN